MTLVQSRSAAAVSGQGAESGRTIGAVGLQASTGAGRERRHHHTRSSTTAMMRPGADTSVTMMDKSKFQARHDLLTTRSDSYLLRPRQEPEDIWKRPPPDFTLQRYMPKPPKRNTRESMQPWRWGWAPREEKADATGGKGVEAQQVTLPKILQPRRPRSSKMQTKFRIHDPDAARKEAVKKLVHSKDQYRNPKPHDFRQYPPLGPLGLSEFVTYQDRDPYNIKFKTDNIDIVYGLPEELDERFNGIQMGRDLLTPPPKYDASLMHPKGKWPTPSGEFSRYRPRNRSPTTVLMDNVESTLTARWAKEKEERQRRKKAEEEAEKRRVFEQKVAREVAQVSKKNRELEEGRDNEFGAWHDHLLGDQRRKREINSITTASSSYSSAL